MAAHDAHAQGHTAATMTLISAKNAIDSSHPGGLLLLVWVLSASATSSPLPFSFC
jgi:hypothetical protein